MKKDSSNWREQRGKRRKERANLQKRRLGRKRKSQIGKKAWSHSEINTSPKKKKKGEKRNNPTKIDMKTKLDLKHSF